MLFFQLEPTSHHLPLVPTCRISVRPTRIGSLGNVVRFLLKPDKNFFILAVLSVIVPDVVEFAEGPFILLALRAVKVSSKNRVRDEIGAADPDPDLAEAL